MKIGKEKKEIYYRFDVDFEKKEYDILREYGAKEIVKDDNALINYAVNKILVNMIGKGGSLI
jgi:hypothetical protein